MVIGILKFAKGAKLAKVKNEFNEVPDFCVFSNGSNRYQTPWRSVLYLLIPENYFRKSGRWS